MAGPIPGTPMSCFIETCLRSSSVNQPFSIRIGLTRAVAFCRSAESSFWLVGASSYLTDYLSIASGKRFRLTSARSDGMSLWENSSGSNHLLGNHAIASGDGSEPALRDLEDALSDGVCCVEQEHAGQSLRRRKVQHVKRRISKYLFCVHPKREAKRMRIGGTIKRNDLCAAYRSLQL